MNLKVQAEDWLMVLLWGAEKLMTPTLRSLFEPFEAWEYRHRFRRQFRQLEQRQMVKRERRAGQIIYRLTERGRLVALGGRDPNAHWQRPWDGQWRMILFDLPVGCQAVRVQLLRWLRQNGFGYLQNSVWIHPHPLTKLSAALREFRDDVESLTVMESHCCAGYSNAAIVQGAWDFPEINRRYQAYLSIATTDLRRLCARQPAASALATWLHRERTAWKHALSLDPLLPSELLPSDYLGRRAWQARQVAFATFVKQQPV